MYVGTQVRPRDDSDYRVWAQLGVRHVCVDPPGDPHHWSLDDLRRHKDHVESFGLSLDMVQLPLSSRPIEQAESPNILLWREPDRKREIDSICGLIERARRGRHTGRQVQSLHHLLPMRRWRDAGPFAAAAEAAGFDAVTTAELGHDVFTPLAFAALATERIELTPSIDADR